MIFTSEDLKHNKHIEICYPINKLQDLLEVTNPEDHFPEKLIKKPIIKLFLLLKRKPSNEPDIIINLDNSDEDIKVDMNTTKKIFILNENNEELYSKTYTEMYSIYDEIASSHDSYDFNENLYNYVSNLCSLPSDCYIKIFILKIHENIADITEVPDITKYKWCMTLNYNNKLLSSTDEPSIWFLSIDDDDEVNGLYMYFYIDNKIADGLSSVKVDKKLNILEEALTYKSVPHCLNGPSIRKYYVNENNTVEIIDDREWFIGGIHYNFDDYIMELEKIDKSKQMYCKLKYLK